MLPNEQPALGTTKKLTAACPECNGQLMLELLAGTLYARCERAHRFTMRDYLHEDGAYLFGGLSRTDDAATPSDG